MLVIRMQRTGRHGHTQFRVVVQDSRQTPTSGKFIALLGSYDPHTKIAQLDKEKVEHFIKNGAQPSERVALLLKKEGVKLPDWVSVNSKKSGTLRNPEKLRKNRPAGTEEPKPAAEEAEPAETPAEPEEPATEQLAEEAKPETEKSEEAEAATDTATEGVEAETTASEEKQVEEAEVSEKVEETAQAEADAPETKPDPVEDTETTEKELTSGEQDAATK